MRQWHGVKASDVDEAKAIPKLTINNPFSFIRAELFTFTHPTTPLLI